MNISLPELIDRVNAAHFWDRALPKQERDKVSTAICNCHAKPGAYANTFALTPAERRSGWQVFTGEKATSASARHIAGEEACRALRLLNVKNSGASKALNAATEELSRCLDRAEAAVDHRMGGNPGIFCCGRCSVSVWRHVTAGGFDRHEERLAAGTARLKDFRDGNGRWELFPFWYAISALIEMDVKPAIQELKYAAPILGRAAGRKPSSDEYSRRRQELASRALAKI